MHRAVAELRDEIDGHEVEVATNETAHAELAAAIFTLLVVHHLLPDVAEAVHLGDDGDVAVHLTVDLDALHHLVAVGLQAAVEVVQPLFFSVTCPHPIKPHLIIYVNWKKNR